MRILLVEDDEELCELIAFALAEEGYRVDVCHEGDDGLRWLGERAHDLVLLDRMLPRLDGAEVLRRARAAGIHTPVVLITALGGVDDRIRGLDLGADDYLVKPFAVGELLARIRAVARRPRGFSADSAIRCGALVLDPLEKVLRCGDKAVSLSRKETQLLSLLLRNPGEILPRQVLFTHVWGPDAGVEEGSLDNYIHFVRRHLAGVGSPYEIVTIRQTGYRLAEQGQ